MYPSLYEGFGLPILEAFKAGCPMLLSDTECFREVAADAAVYFKATDLEDLIHTLETTLMDTELKKQLVARGTERLKRFQLRDCIDQTLAVYRSLA
nr:glycosyltransferase [Siphonobacter sp. BAB-5405]